MSEGGLRDARCEGRRPCVVARSRLYSPQCLLYLSVASLGVGSVADHRCPGPAGRTDRVQKGKSLDDARAVRPEERNGAVQKQQPESCLGKFISVCLYLIVHTGMLAVVIRI